MQPRVWQDKEWCIQPRRTIKQEIEINGAGKFLRFFLSSEQIFDPKHSGHHLRRADLIDLYLDGHVEERRCSWHIDRVRFIKARHLCHIKACLKKPPNS